MTQETVTYLTNIIIGVILSVLATHYWWHHRNAGAIRHWVWAAWVLTLTDVLFATRQWLPFSLGRLLPTLGVTLGHALLLVAAQQTAGVPQRRRVVTAVVAVHGLALLLFLYQTQPSNWRMICNGLVWGGFSLATALTLRRGAETFWRSFASPAAVFLIHGLFHCLRIACAVLFEANDWREASAVLQVVGDLEVSFFMVALFVGLLIAHLQLRHEALMSAQAEVQTLSGLLPMCAWCKKVRDDQGYWEQVEDYLERRSQLKFTHGMCNSCLEDVRAKENLPEPGA